jgi:hypothetical protein
MLASIYGMTRLASRIYVAVLATGHVGLTAPGRGV